MVLFLVIFYRLQSPMGYASRCNVNVSEVINCIERSVRKKVIERDGQGKSIVCYVLNKCRI